VAIRLSQLPPMKSMGLHQGRVQGVGVPEGQVAMGAFLVQVLRYAYNLNSDFPQNRVIIPANQINVLYDFVDTMPQGGRDILRQKLKDQFGLTARLEMQSNLLLVVKDPAAGGLHKHTKNGDYQSHNVTMEMIAEELSRQLGVTVTDRTRLAGGFDYTLDLPDSPTPDDIKKAITDQLGLGLIPADDNQSVEFLIAEQVR
jgi:uncharacterized protein (TIGR03435 family)